MVVEWEPNAGDLRISPQNLPTSGFLSHVLREGVSPLYIYPHFPHLPQGNKMPTMPSKGHSLRCRGYTCVEVTNKVVRGGVFVGSGTFVGAYPTGWGLIFVLAWFLCWVALWWEVAGRGN